MPIRRSLRRGYSLAKAKRRLRRASKHVSSDVRDEARAGLRSVLEGLPEDSDSVALREILLQASQVADKLDGSRRLVGLLRAHLSKVPEDLEAWLALARVLAASGDVESAVEACDEGVKGVGGADELLLLKGTLLAESGEGEKAADVLQRVVESGDLWWQAMESLEAMEGPSANLLLLRGRRSLEAGDDERALQLFDQALEEDPRCVDALLHKAEILIAQESYDEAHDCAISAIELKSTRADVWFTRSRSEELLGRRAEAARSLEVGLRYEPYNLEMLKGFGRLLLEQQRYEEAAEVYERALEIAADDADALEGWRSCQRELGRMESYRRACRMLSEVDPRRWDVCLDEARSWMDSGKPERAAELLQRVLRDNRHSLEASTNVADLALESELWEVALAASEHILRGRPRDHEALRHKGMALKGLDRTEEALQAFTKATRLKPDLKALEAKREILEASGPSKALYVCCEEIVRLDSESRQAYLDLSEAANQLGKVRLALQACDRGLNVLPQDVSLLVFKANLLAAEGMAGDALRVYEKVLEREEDNFHALKGYGICLHAVGSYPEAEVALEKAIGVREDAECLYYRGLSLQEADRLKEAIECLDRSVEMKGGEKAWMAHGMALLQDNRVQKALYSFEKVLELRPDNSGARLRRAECLIQLREFAEALRGLDESPSPDDESYEFHYTRIECLMELERSMEAYEASANLTRLAQKDSQAWTLRASIASSLGLTTEALECLEKAAKLGPEDPAPKLEEARVLLTLKDYEAALQVAQEVISKYRESTAAHVLRGQALTGLERLEDATAAFTVALTLSPKDEEALRGRALSLARMKKPGEALRSIDALMKQSPADPWSHYWKAEVLREGGQWDEALRSLNQALYYGGSKPAFLAKKVITLHHLGRDNEALHVVEDALETYPEESSLIAAKASLLLELGRNQEALLLLDAGLGGRQRDEELLLLKAQALEALGRWEEGVEALREAIRGSSPSKGVWLRCADLYLKMGREEASLASYDKAIERDPADADLWKGRGRLCERLGRWGEAIHAYSAALGITPKDESTLAAVGRAYTELGLYEEAEDSYQRALSVNPTLEEAMEGQRGLVERRQKERVEAYAWRILEFEAVNARPATREEAFKYCNVPVEFLEEVIEYVNEPQPLDVLSLREGEFRRLEAISRDILSTTLPSAGVPRLYEVVQEFPHMDLRDVRRALEYMQGVFALEASEEQASGMERLMKLALEIPRDEWNALSLARNLHIGAYESKRLEGALRIFRQPGVAAELEIPQSTRPTGLRADRGCRKHGAPGIYQHFCGQYLCSACIVGGKCPVCHHPVSRAAQGYRGGDGGEGSDLD